MFTSRPLGVAAVAVAVTLAALAPGSGLASRSAGAALPQWAACVEGVRFSGYVRPKKIVVACADGNFYVTALRWSRWTAKDALAVGVSHQNLCTPDCARGRFATYPIQIRLYRPLACRDGLQFTWLYYRYPRDKPPRINRTGTWSRRGCH
jgi:hypothetical protein